MVLVDDGHAVVVMPDPLVENVTASALDDLAGSRFNPMQSTVGDLVGKNVNDSRMQIDASALSYLSSRPLGVVQAMVSSKPFDPMLPTIGDLVGTKAVDVTASAPPAVRRIDGRFDPMQPTVGDLVTKTARGHPSLRTITAEPGDITVHPRRIRMCSR